MRWERVQQQNAGEKGIQDQISGPGKRWGHTCSAIKGGKLLYVFGGYGRDNCQTNRVHVYDTVNQSWNEPVLKGALPAARDSHSCTAVGDNLFVFGGTDGMKPLNDLHILDTSSNTWVCPSIKGDKPEAREGHGAALVGKRLFIFGGCGKSLSSSTEVFYNDLFVLDTDAFIWNRACTSGTPPSERYTHSCSSWNNKIIVIGGEDAHDYYLSDVHILDADTLVWKELNTSGQLLAPRGGHTTISIRKSLFVFGGFTDSQNLYSDLHMLDIETGVWTNVTATGDGPSARFSVAGDSLDSVKSGVLVFIGGCSRQLEALDDMFYLYTELMSENHGDTQDMVKLSMRKQLKLKCQSWYLCPPVHNKSLLTIGTTAELHKPIPVPIFDQPSTRESYSIQGKKSFQAKVTQSFKHGYAIETIIDGKPLRGILFSNRPSSFHATSISNRKRPAPESSGVVKWCGDHNGKLKTENIVERNKIGLGQTYCAEVNLPALSESESHFTEFVSPAQKVGVEIPGPSESSILNLKDEKIDDLMDCSPKVSEEHASSAAVLDNNANTSLKPDGRAHTGNEFIQQTNSL